MPAYVISEVEMGDATDFEAYRTIAAKTIAQYGGWCAAALQARSKAVRRRRCSRSAKQKGPPVGRPFFILLDHQRR